MLGCRSFAIIRASERNRWLIAEWTASSGCTTFTATGRSRVVSVARKTTPIPPAPSSRSSRYWLPSAAWRLPKSEVGTVVTIGS
jgi:hypothetical protein